ncbi:hypothetical protein SDC9_143698 [bioreactor metagenome]|uniref:Uncharacterized protein n=1 Tax=bioreactor metagenome TaxID=1076179 RepID=A0A645E422_9ZZZZ
MRQTNNGIALFLILQVSRHFIGSENRVVINNTLTFIGLYQSFQLRPQPKDPNLQSIAIQ